MAKTRPTFDFCSFETIAISTRLEACPFSPPQNAGQPLSPDPAHGLMISPVVFPPCQNPRPPHVAAFQVPVKRIWAPTGLGDGLRDAWASMTHKDIGGADERTAGGHDRVVPSLVIFARSRPSSRRRTNRRPLDEQWQGRDPTIKLRVSNLECPAAVEFSTATLIISRGSVDNQERPSHRLPCITPGIAFWLNSERVLAHPNPLIS